MDIDSDEELYRSELDPAPEIQAPSPVPRGRPVSRYFALSCRPGAACFACNALPRFNTKFSHLNRVDTLKLLQRNVVATQSMRICQACARDFDPSTVTHSGLEATAQQWSTCITYLKPRLKVKESNERNDTQPPSLASFEPSTIHQRTRSSAMPEQNDDKEDVEMASCDQEKCDEPGAVQPEEEDPEDLSFLDDPDWHPPMSIPEIPSIRHLCDNPACNNIEELPHTFKHCSHCLCTWYCSKACQRAHWNGDDPHRPVCKAVSRHVDRRQDMTKEDAYNAPWHDLRTLSPSEVHAAFGLDAESIQNFATRMFPSFPPPRERRGRKPKLSSLDKTKLFLLWFRTAVSQTVLGALFDVSSTTAGRIIDDILDRAEDNFIKFFLGFGPEHRYFAQPINRDTIIDMLSTWTSQQIGKDIFGGTDILGVADGTYVYCMNAGGFRANKLLYSGHKHRLLSKVMVLCTTRGYILDIWGGYGGGGKFSDVKIWKSIISDAKKDNGPNILTALPQHSGIVVDRGFRDKDGSTDNFFTLLAPKGNKKAKKGKKSKDNLDHIEITGDQNLSRFVTKIRNVVERINICAIKKWGILGGRNLHHRFLPRVNTLSRLAGALFNCYRGPLDEYGDDEEHRQDYQTMKDRCSHINKIPGLIDDGYRSFTKATFDVDELPSISREDIRRFATGPYGMTLSERYLRYARDYHDSPTDEDAVLLRGTAFELPNNSEMIEAVGIRSRFRSGVGRRVKVLFEDGRIEDTWCSCPGGYRTIGGCAHSIAVLRLISELQSGRKWDVKPKDPDLDWMLLADDDAVDDEDESEDEGDE